MKDFFSKAILYFPLPYWLQDYLFAHFIVGFLSRRKIRLETKAFYVFDDDSILNKMAFIDICDHKGKCWPDEYEKIRLKYEI